MALLSQGYSFVAGLDEAGRGSLAGPVVAAAVILPLSEDCSTRLAGVRDSKLLTAQARERLYKVIMQHALAVGMGSGSVELIDERNYFAGYEMGHAFRACSTENSPPGTTARCNALA